MNLYDLFHETAQRQPDRPAFLGSGQDGVINYASADELVQRTASCLARDGVRPGVCVGLHCPTGVNCVIATYAAWRCGAFVLPIPTELTWSEKEQILRTVAVDCIVSPTNKAAIFANWQTGSVTDIMPSMVHVPIRREREHPTELAAINAAFVRFTSGTTATAKGVVLSHETVYERIQAANEVLHIGPDDRVVWLLSMAYHFAVTIVSYLTFGAGIILAPNHFAHAVLDATRRYAGTMIYGSPAHFAWLASSPDAAPLQGVRQAISTTSALDRRTAIEFQHRFNIPLTQALGIIEVGLPFINHRFAVERPEAVGQLLPAYEMQLKDVGAGNEGHEILLRGRGFLDAYYEPWRSRTSIMPDGWFHTGDVAMVDADGCVTLCGRRKDMISVLGMKFFPQEVEAILTGHPAVAEACVFCQGDPRMGEVPEANVVLRPGYTSTEGELIAYCEKQLALFKIPRRIHFVSSLRRTASGKVLHRTASNSTDVREGVA